MENKLEKLNKFANDHLQTYFKWVEVFKRLNLLRIEEKFLMIKNGTNSIWYDYQSFALKAFFVDKDMALTKQHFYTCGVLDEYQVTKLDSDVLDWGLNHFAYVLLSDNVDLIERYANLSHSYYKRNIDRGLATPSYILQCLVKDNWTEYEKAIVIMKGKTLKKYPAMQWDVQFFEGMAERNKAKIEEALTGLVSSKIHKQRNKLYILLNEFISHPALGYAKLAWLKGIEVQVDSPLVPKKLLPVAPLDNYVNEYEFLHEIELPK